MIEWGWQNELAFDPAKCDLIHLDRGRGGNQTVRVGSDDIAPSPIVRWLGFFFDRKLSFQEHAERWGFKALKVE